MEGGGGVGEAFGRGQGRERVWGGAGADTLKDLLKNSNVLSSLRNVYKTLTTDEDQKKSFRAHIIKWTQDTLAPVRLNDTGPDKEEEETIAEAGGGTEKACRRRHSRQAPRFY